MNDFLHFDAARRAKSANGQMTFTLVEDSEIDGRRYRRGEVVTMAVLPADVTVQTEELDTYLGGYSPFGYGADLVSKIVLVDKESEQRRDFSSDNTFLPVNVESGRSGAINEIEWASSLTPYRVKDYALATFIPWQTENDASALYRVRAVAGEIVTNKLLLAREIRIWNDVTTTSKWNANNYTTLTTNFKWNNGSTKDPRADLHARIKASAQPVTDIFMNPDVAYWLLSDDKFRAYMKQMLGDGAPNPDVAAAADSGGFGVMSFNVPGYPTFWIIPSKKKNVSTGNLDFCLGNDVVLVTNQPGVPRDGNRVATHYTFRTKGRSGTGIVTNEYQPQGRGINGGTMFEVGHADDAFFASNVAGGLIKDVLG